MSKATADFFTAAVLIAGVLLVVGLLIWLAVA